MLLGFFILILGFSHHVKTERFYTGHLGHIFTPVMDLDSLEWATGATLPSPSLKSIRPHRSPVVTRPYFTGGRGGVSKLVGRPLTSSLHFKFFFLFLLCPCLCWTFVMHSSDGLSSPHSVPGRWRFLCAPSSPHHDFQSIVLHMWRTFRVFLRINRYGIPWTNEWYFIPPTLVTLVTQVWKGHQVSSSRKQNCVIFSPTL